MAKQKNNIIMRSTRGMVGGQIVFKRRAGKGYVSAAPEVNENRVPTNGQQTAQEKFAASVAYAKLAIKEPAVKDAYKAVALRNQSAFNVAFQDAYNAPKVTAVITDGYTGAVGNTIVVRATDDFKVSSVKVSIRNENDEVIEEGPAVLSTGDLWIYTTTQSNPDFSGTKIKTSAFDMPENEGFLEVTL
jgi:hypothetical protein